MTHLREHWEGVSVSDDYTLEQWLGGDDSAAFFQTSIAPDGRRAVAKLIPETVANGDAPLDLWHRTRQLRHPNLVELLDCGRAQHGGEIVLYAVFESPDDTLASALSRSPLNELESREVLDSVIDALRYLHAQGLVLGALDPDHIVAIGDRIKVSTGALREADTSSAYREDVRLLGDLWREALMPASPKSAEIAAHAADPNPKSRWTLAEISAALGPPLPAEPPPAPPVIVAPPIPGPLVEVSPVTVPPVVVSVPKVDLQHGDAERLRETRRRNLESATLPPPHRRIPEHATSSRFPKWVFVGAAAILLLILFLILNRPHSTGAAAKSRVAAVSPPVENPVPAPLPKIAAPKPSVPVAPKRSPDASQEVWRVIAFTYRTREAAVKKAQQLNEYHPGIDANVFLPPKERGYYLVSLGGRMTPKEAERVQRSARGKGLPRDLYVQNYSR
jgi:eukaryotic-like serine/threonine-protein kinase